MNACTAIQLGRNMFTSNLRFSIKTTLIIVCTWPLLFVLLLGCNGTGHDAKQVHTTPQETRAEPVEQPPLPVVRGETPAHTDDLVILDYPTPDIHGYAETASPLPRFAELAEQMHLLNERTAANTNATINEGDSTIPELKDHSNATASSTAEGFDPGLTWYYLVHGGPDWDDGLTDSVLSLHAITNFLTQLSSTATITFPIDIRPRSIGIDQLAQLPSEDIPPFIFLTGHGAIPLSESDKRLLHDYITKGGLLLVDAASPSFDRAFRALMVDIFPNNPLATIANDDDIFQRPYRLPHGIDPLYAHGGTEAKGIRIGNRWGVLYHPGDIKDAFKGNAHRLSAHLRDHAFKCMCNFIYYSIVN